MKVHKTLLTGSKHWIVCAVLCVTSLSHSVHPQTNTNAKKADTNAPPAPAPFPQSVFNIPRTLQEGRDPFYPKSTYFIGKAPAPVVSKDPVVVHVDLKLQGFSGPPNHRLAIINGRTMEQGEEAEVNTPNGKVPVRLIEIKAESVVVQTPADRQELKLRGGL